MSSNVVVVVSSNVNVDVSSNVSVDVNSNVNVVVRYRHTVEKKHVYIARVAYAPARTNEGQTEGKVSSNPTCFPP